MEESVSFARHYCGCQDVGLKPFAKLRSAYTIVWAHKWVLARPLLSRTEKGAPPLLHCINSTCFPGGKSGFHTNKISPPPPLSLQLFYSNVSKELLASHRILVGCDLASSLGNLALLAMHTTFSTPSEPTGRKAAYAYVILFCMCMDLRACVILLCHSLWFFQMYWVQM